MSSDAEFPDEPNTPVRVATACQGPVGGDCGHRILTHVPSFGSADEKHGVRCGVCWRVNHVGWRDALGGGEDA